MPLNWFITVLNVYEDSNQFYIPGSGKQKTNLAESSKSCNLIGSEGGQFFTILPANPGGIVGSFIHKFVCCLWMSKTGDF